MEYITSVMWSPQQTVVAKLMNRLQNKETTVEFLGNGTGNVLFFLEDDAWVDTVIFCFRFTFFLVETHHFSC